MDISQLRQEIDAVDAELVRLFKRRMEISSGIAEYKREHSLPIKDHARERQKLYEIAEQAGEDMRTYAASLYTLLFELSRSHQRSLTAGDGEIARRINAAVKDTPAEFPAFSVVACQGIEGAFSQLACEKMFGVPNIMYFNSFEGVFSAIASGMCRYGVLPVENSTAGSVNAVYDLMTRYNFSIVRSTRLKIDCNLMAKKGARLEDIKEIFSHPHAINQCQAFLKEHKNITVTVCENTAGAALLVAESGRTDVAAVSSRSCAELYGLDCLAESIQDNGNNYTRFICISKNLEIYPGADRTSIMMSVANTPGSLYNVLSKFFALGVNLVKLESRPIPDRDFEFMFYFDLDVPVYSKNLSALIGELEAMSEDSGERFRYLGSYSEIV